MNRKQQLLKTVQILTAGDTFVLKVAQQVLEGSLPKFQSEAAWEFLVVMARFRSTACGDTLGSTTPSRFPCPKR